MVPLDRSSMEPTRITDLSAVELARETTSGRLSATAVVEAFLAQVDKVNPGLNAIAIPLFEEARARAKELDEAFTRGDVPGPLHGVPITIKEQFRVAGTQITLGAKNKIGNVYNTEGPLVRKLREAGAVILGKTNVLQTLSGWETDNRVYGRTNNPWDHARSPGGSSGGDSAIIAARGAPLALAADFGGSIRIPAHFCGLHGLKPTSGRLTSDDFPPGLMSVNHGQEVVVQQPGPIAGTVADLTLAMRLLTETSSEEITRDVVAPTVWPDPAAVQIKGMRIGMYVENGHFPVSPAIRRAILEAADALRSMGATVEPIVPPDAREAIRIFIGATSAGGGKFFKTLLGDEEPIPQVADLLRGIWTKPALLRVAAWLQDMKGQGHQAYAMRCLGTRSVAEYWSLADARTDFRQKFLQSLDDGHFDAVICPPFALPAIPHNTCQHLLPSAGYAIVYNVIGAPAGVVSLTNVRPDEESDRVVSRDLADITASAVEQGSAGLPVGVQVVARHWREDIVLAVMSALEDHFRSKPDYPTIPENSLADQPVA
ncbi:amidase [Sulfitobacter sp. MF3-043]|uniref:amidase n=1 Tax=Sulfitobacter sediminivivens TaxID=3252902 RepID=UPI0036DF395B